MDKEQIQEQELNQVTGGKSKYNHRCPMCENMYFRDDKYPEGWYYGTKKDGCTTWTINKCPNCGYEFESC